MQDNPPIPVIGVIRFSVLTEDYYSARFGTVEKIAEHLFSPERLELRFRLFETFCLPTLAAQTDPDFKCVVLTSTLLPDEARARLDALISRHPQFSVMAGNPQKHYPLLRKAFRSATPGDAPRRLWFRVDDDDALSLDYIARLRRIASHLDALHPEEPFAIAFNSGFYVEVTGDDAENPILDCVERAPLSVGTAVLTGGDDHRNPYRFNHRALGQRYNLYTDISEPVFLRSVHADNKSDPTRQGIAGKMDAAEIDTHVRERFGLDPDRLRAF